MHKVLVFAILLIFTIGCKQQSKTTEAHTPTQDVVVKKPNYPETLAKVFEAHGGVDLWKKQRTLEYTIPKGENPEMTWLGYTVTYRTGEDSDNIKWIRYDDWATYNGLVLPKSISWYNYEGRTIKDMRNKVPFENVNLSTEAKSTDFYSKPETATYWEKPE